jgi:tetratricopeptide (TPR) repeat protein
MSSPLTRALTAILFLALPLSLQAEHIMDSVDALNSALGATQTQLERGDFKDVLGNAQKAVQLAQDRFGPLHPSVAPYFDNLAVVDETLALYSDSESNFKWSLALREKTLGPNDPALVYSLVPLARLYDQLGRFPEASLMVQRALALEQLSKKTPGPEIADTLNLESDIEEHQGRLDEAVSYLQQALTESSTEDKGQNQTLVLTHLARLETARKNYGAAEADLQNALETIRENAAPGSVEIADGLKNMADLYQAQGLLDKAHDFASQALALDLHFIGPEDTYANIPYHQRGADSYFALGQWKDADALYQRVLKIKTEVYGPNHPEVALSLENLAQTAEAAQDKAGARKDLESARTILEKYFGPDHPLILDVKKRLTDLNQP